ncbi:hypothetical protein DFH27DRAFT_557083 [Peziza echinospora]|nr:hypothetical protein DFH27DRAFT_557083 [Peziza echinospora]
MLSLPRSFTACCRRALCSSTKLPAIRYAVNQELHTYNASRPTLLPSRLQLPSTIHRPHRRLKATQSESSTSSDSDAITELPEGQYRDYSALPKSLMAKTDLYIPVGMLSRARTIAQEHTVFKELLEKDYENATAIKVGKLAPVAKAMREYDEGFYNLSQIRDMLQWSDPTLSDDLLTELADAKTALQSLASSLAASLIPPHPFAHLACIVEIRPGTGGSEAAIFANNLFKMYSSYFSQKGWPVSMISLDTASDIMGSGEAINEAIFSVDSPGAYAVLRGESGVHRVQRIPLTETKGRVHTSTATIMVLPLFPEGSSDAELNSIIDPKDVRTDVMRSRGAGGQHVNTTDSAVRLTHIPTGIVAAIQETRSQHKNREKAWTVLRARVAEKFRAEKEAEEIALRRRTMGGSSGVEATGSGGGRSDKIRTYNYKEDRITDHRCGLTIYDLENIMTGDVQGVEKVLEEVGKWQMQQEMNKVAAETGV